MKRIKEAEVRITIISLTTRKKVVSFEPKIILKKKRITAKPMKDLNLISLVLSEELKIISFYR